MLLRHEKQGAPDRPSLLIRARNDERLLQAALYGDARYGGAVTISFDGRMLDAVDLVDTPADAKQPVSVHIAVAPGPRFRFGNVVIDEYPTAAATVSRDPRDYGLVTGEDARSETIVAAMGKVVQHWRSAGFPFARIQKSEVVANHAHQSVDVRISIDPGQPAVYGWINVVGTKRLKSRIVADQSALRSGARYSPESLVKTRERLRRLESIESVRIIEGKQIDDAGGIPITLDVTERKPRYVGITASVTSLDGVEAKAHWGHRNLFGGGEQLRVEGAVSQIGVARFDDLEFNISATLIKPGILDIDTNLFTQFSAAREANDAFQSDVVTAKIGVERRYGEQLSANLALEGRYIGEKDETEAVSSYTLLSLPGHATYDTRNSRFDPNNGVRFDARLAPVIDIDDADAFFTGELDLASYWSLDAEDRAIVAMRFRSGSTFGSSLSSIPASYGFLAGGGNSVRGYAYRSIGATFDGRLTSGLSYASWAAELRLRPIRQFGIVPFVDVATVSLDRVPKFSDSVYVGAGLGLRYFTALGPIRLDVAAPLTNRKNRSKFGIYVGLGQAF
ncbi:MAG: outer membrane protein assembly factor [Hyphomicrobiaceae bacterium]